jgi:hypothetical protein
MSKFVTCPNCGCNLDHGEVCDCKQRREMAPDAGHAASKYADQPTRKNWQGLVLRHGA